MADYTVRIVLHDATATHYQRLHEAMEAAGAKRQIRGDSGILFDLPDGEYVMSNSLTAVRLRDAVVDIATAVKAEPSPSVLVTETLSWAWMLRPAPGQS